MFNKNSLLTRYKVPFTGLLIGLSLFVGAQRAQASLFDGSVWDVLNEFFSGSTAASSGQTLGIGIKNVIKEVGKQILQNLAKQMINKMTESTVNWINSGFEGNPQFVANPKSFFKDVGNTQLKFAVDTIGYNATQFPFGREVAKGIVLAQRVQQGGIQSQLQFTLDKVVGAGANWKNFETDFSVGGWSAYEAMSQNPANNPLGFMLAANQQVDKAVADAQGALDKELAKGQGFLDQKVCIKKREGPSKAFIGPPDPNKPTPKPSLSQNLSGIDDADCLEYKTVSPGSVVQTQINKALSSKFTQSELGQAMGNSISNIVNALTNQLVSKGLGALSTAISGGAQDSGEDTWSYDGLTLSGPTNGSLVDGTSNWASGPDRTYDLQELLIDGPILKSEVVLRKNPQTGLDEQQIVVKERGPTVLAKSKEQADTYRKAVDQIQSIGIQLFALDQCIPGPDYHWQDRFKDTVGRAKRKLDKKAASSNEKKADAASKGLDRVDQGVDVIQRNISLKILDKNIPGYVEMTDEVARTSRFALKAKEYYDDLLTATTTTARLQSIKDRYMAIGYNPNNPDPTKLARVNALIKEYAILEQDIPNDITLGTAQDTLANILTEKTKVAAFMNPNNPNSCPAQKADPKNQVLFTQDGITYSAYGRGLAYTSTRILPLELRGITIVSTVSATDMISQLKQNYGATPVTEGSLGGLDPEELMYVYSIVIGNSQSNTIPGKTGNDLVAAAIDLVNNMDGTSSQVAFTLNAEETFYCQQEVDKVDLQNVYKSMDINIHCDKFYHSLPTDYTIDKHY